MQVSEESGVEHFMDEARQIAGQCWCDEETSNIEMDVVLAEVFARRLAVVLSISAQQFRNVDFWKGLLYECVDAMGDFGKEVYIQDDGGVVDTPLALKVPEAVRKLAASKSN